MTASKRSTRWTLALVVVAVLACLLLGLLFAPRYFQRGQDYLGRPLVQIHSPADGERLTFGQRVPAIARARSEAGITRMELWAEGRVIDTHEAPDGETLSPMTLAAAWSPTTLGPHRVTVRAYTPRGLAGYASVDVEVVEGATTLGSHTVSEGERLENIALDYGIALDELADLNPGLPADGPAPGSELTVPLSGAPSDDTPPSEAVGERAPEAPDGPAPEGYPGGAEESSRLVVLRLEALDLRTDAGYESLHCYAAVGGRPPRWFPDADGDPATDESFAPRRGTHWDIAAHFSGSEAPLLVWPGDTDLPFDITCVGVRGAGTDALELGHLALAIPPAAWDGERRRASAAAEGGFELEYRVGFANLEPKELDLSMAVPQNVRYDDRRQSLRWDYTPNPGPEGEAEIDGFLVFLNDSLVFEVDADERESRLPEAWLVPPCSESYRFTLRAFHRPYPDGAYSDASDPATLAGGEPGTEACGREVLVNFRHLDVFDMGDDGDDDAAVMGPIDGWVSANGTFHSFGNPPSVSIPNNSSFNLDTFFWDDYSEANSFLVPLAEGEQLHISFNMDDNDRRRRYDSGICTGYDDLRYDDLLAGPVEDSFDATRSSEEEVRCRIEYTIEPAPGSPVGAAGGGLLLPWLDLTDVTLDRATGELQLYITNTGNAAWANHDLDVRVTSRDGEETGTHTWPLFYLDPLEEAVLQDPSLTAESPEAACVHLDYNDRVLESHENTGSFHHAPLCPPLPDLIIEDVQYEADDAQLQVTVRNDGDGAVDDRVVSVDLLRPDGSPITAPLRPTVALLEHAQSTTITWPSIDASLRAAMLGGYTVRLNAAGQLLEEDPTNNDFTVPAGQRVWLDYTGMETAGYFAWCWLGECNPLTHHFVVSLSASVVGGSSTMPVESWSDDFHWEPEGLTSARTTSTPDRSTPTLLLGGDEQLLVEGSASVRQAGRATRHDVGSFALRYDFRDPSEAQAWETFQHCNLIDREGHYRIVVESTGVGDVFMPRWWSAHYCLGRIME
jgi:hypothetical protein